jgi:hypothetical protein
MALNGSRLLLEIKPRSPVTFVDAVRVLFA